MSFSSSSKPSKSAKSGTTSTVHPQTRTFLLSARTRNQLASSQSSSISSDQINSMPSVSLAQQANTSPSSPVLSSSAAAATVTRSPASSPPNVIQSPKMSPEKVREAVNKIRQELSSPLPSSSSNTSSTANSPSIYFVPAITADSQLVGETSRLSISPGAPPPISAELMAFMKNTSNMLREQQAANEMLVRRLADMESAYAEQRSSMESMQRLLNKSSVERSEPVTISDEQADDYTPLQMPLRYDTDSVSHHIDEQDDDEQKYPVDELPTDKAEANIMQQENQYADQEIMMPTDEDDHIDDYLAWLSRRQKLYPFEDKKNSKLYTPRHSLLSPNGRLREYSRFGFLTGWDTRLFGDLANRWFRRVLHDHGVATDKDGKRPRSVSIHLVRVPAMSYDDRDRLSAVRTGEENELPVNSYTLSMIPLPLRCDPGAALARTHSLSLQEEVQVYISQRKRLMVAKGQLDDDSSDGDESSTSSSIASYERRTCSKCDRPVFGLRNLCSIHSQKVERRTDDQEFEAALRHRREQAARSNEPSAVKIETQSMSSSFVQPSMPEVQRSTVTVSPYGLAAREMSSVKAEAMPPLNQMEDEPISYPAQRLKQESSIRFNRLQKEEQDRINGLSDIDKIEESSSVLGSILSRAFTPAVRATLRTGKLTAGTRLTGKDRIAAVEEMKKNGFTFSGDRMKAPAYLRKLCATVLKWDLNAGEVYQVMESTMDRQAATWLQDTWAMTGELPHGVKPIETLLDSFMRLWMDQTTRRMFRDALRSLRMPTETATLDELNTHYAKFSEYLNGLRMCDKHVDMQDIIHEYFETLPNRVQAFIGTRYMSALSIAEVHAEAETALRTMHKRRVPKQDGELGEVVSVNAMTEYIPVNAFPSQQRQQSKDNSYDKQDKRDVVCWHCGDKGHYAGLDCPYINQNQTRRGQAAWAEHNKRSYNPRPYDKEYYIQRSRQRQAVAAPAQRQPSSTALVARPTSSKTVVTQSNNNAPKKVAFTHSDKKKGRDGGRLRKVNGSAIVKRGGQPELDDDEEEAGDQ